jgi:hypothetical protein
MRTRKIIAILLAVVFGIVSGYARIVYVNGPSFPVPPRDGSAGVDLNGDGTVDFAFSSGAMLCTDDVPTSACVWSFHVGATGTNQMLLNNYDAQAQRFGIWIGSNAPVGTAWSSPNFAYSSAGLTYWWWHRIWRSGDGLIIGVANPEPSPLPPGQFDDPDDEPLYESGWSGPLGELGVGYLGVRFQAADGLHYGWIRVRLPGSNLGAGGFPFELTPVAVDWAYETKPNKPIRAGDIDSSREAVQFTVELFNQRHRPFRSAHRLGTGTLILTDNTLRGELTLSGKFSSAEIRGPARIRGKAKAVWNAEQPLLARSDYTAFFVGATLSRAEVIQLLRGVLYVSVDDDAVLGRIEVTNDDPNQRR